MSALAFASGPIAIKQEGIFWVRIVTDGKIQVGILYFGYATVWCFIDYILVFQFHMIEGLLLATTPCCAIAREQEAPLAFVVRERTARCLLLPLGKSQVGAKVELGTLFLVFEQDSDDATLPISFVFSRRMGDDFYLVDILRADTFEIGGQVIAGKLHLPVADVNLCTVVAIDTHTSFFCPDTWQ